MLKIWGNADSVNVQKVLWISEELGLDYQRIDAGRHYGIVDTTGFRALNPNGLVPTIEDDDFVVWESNTIVRYLAAKYSDGGWWPLNVKDRADADRWMDWAASTLWPTLLPLFRAFMRTAPERRDLAAIEYFRLEAIEVMTILDAALAKSPFIAGAAITMGDIALGPGVWRWFALPISRPDLPALNHWFARLAERAPFSDHVMLPLT